MEFNGTYLEYFGHIIINNKYWKLHKYNVIILPIRVKTLELCIIDELKELFNITKIGTRWTKVKNSAYVLYKVIVDNNNEVIEPLRITDFNNKQCYKIYFFRELFGIPTNKNVIEGIFINKEFVNFYDIKRQKITNDDCGKISIKEKEEFYLKIKRRDIAKFCFNINDIFEIDKLKDNIFKVTNNIDQTYNYLSYNIYNKLLRIHDLE